MTRGAGSMPRAAFDERPTGNGYSAGLSRYGKRWAREKSFLKKEFTEVSEGHVSKARFVLRNCRDKAIEVLRNAKYPRREKKPDGITRPAKDPISQNYVASELYHRYEML